MIDPILKINGREYGGWETVQVTQSMSTIAGSYSFNSSERYPLDPRQWNISMGDACTVEVNKQTLITGSIEDAPYEYEDKKFSLNFSGRDKTGDLVDCGHLSDENEYKDLTAADILTRLLGPFGIELVIDPVLTQEMFTQITPVFAAQPFDSVHDQIKDICQQFGVLPLSFGDGALTIVRSGTKRATDVLAASTNIKRLKFNQSNRKRFSSYTVKGQAIQNPFFTTEAPKGTINDELITRHRPLIVFANKTGYDQERCQIEAAWMAQQLAGMSRSMIITVQDWVQSSGELWKLNTVVEVDDPHTGVKGDRLIAGLEFKVNGKEGSIANIMVVPTDTYVLEKRQPVKKKASPFD